MKSRFMLLFGIAILSCMGFAAECLRAEEVVLPEEIFYYTPIASASGPNVVWTNPAALGQRQLGSVLLFTHRQNRLIRDYGSVTTTRAMGIGYRHLNYDGDDHQEIIFALGGGRRTGFGISYRYMKKSVGYLHHRHLWTVSLLVRQTKNFSIAGRAENLNRSRINGERSDMRFVYGVAMRAYRDLVTLSFDVDMTQNETFRSADYRTGIEVRPIPGMFVYADFDNHSRFNLGFRVNIFNTYVGNRTEFQRDGKTYLSTSYVGTVKGRQASVIKPQRKTLSVGLDGTLPENPDRPFFGQRPLRFFDYIDGIRRAADDDEIDRLFLHIKTLRCGMAKAEELLDALDYFKSKNKPIYAFLSAPNNLSYLVASIADSVFIPPVSSVKLTGLRVELMMYKGLMDKLGVELELLRVDEYKSAAEPYIFDKPTDENRQQVNRWLDVMFNDFVAVIASNRGLFDDSVRAIIDRGPLTSLEAREFGLVDSLMYLDEALQAFAENPNSYWSRQKSFYSYCTETFVDDSWDEKHTIGVIIADGGITAGQSGGAKVGEHEMIGAVRRCYFDRNIDGVLLRINSPGGDALAADLLWHEIEKLAQKKPVVISIGNIAASGGYYIAAINSPIYADKNSLTGSIGVYGGKVNFAELYDKIGIYTETIERGKNAAFFSSSQPYTEEQREKMKSQLWLFYDHFVDKVAGVRPISSDSVNALGRGQVWTGIEAASNGLTDNLGGMWDALGNLLGDMGLDKNNIELKFLPEKYYLFRNPFDIPPYLRTKIQDWVTPGSPVENVLKEPSGGNIFYRIPYDILVE
ncbi:MAG: S49 family peptidase [Candidatus Zixiibacteriota bacterium]